MFSASEKKLFFSACALTSAKSKHCNGSIQRGTILCYTVRLYYIILHHEYGILVIGIYSSRQGIIESEKVLIVHIVFHIVLKWFYLQYKSFILNNFYFLALSDEHILSLFISLYGYYLCIIWLVLIK